jgi:hypothetical protein
MKIAIDKVCFEGIIKQGDLYILNGEGDISSDPGPIEHLYWIGSVEEVVGAVEMEIGIYMGEVYEFRKFNGVCKIGESSYKLDLVCYDREEKRSVPYPLFLHRIGSLGEMFSKAKRLFDVE